MTAILGDILFPKHWGVWLGMSSYSSSYSHFYCCSSHHSALNNLEKCNFEWGEMKNLVHYYDETNPPASLLWIHLNFMDVNFHDNFFLEFLLNICKNWRITGISNQTPSNNHIFFFIFRALCMCLRNIFFQVRTLVKTFVDNIHKYEN